jgi:hypothetical protein
VSPSAAAGSFADDGDLGAQFVRWLDDDLAFLGSARARVDEVLTVADRLGDLLRPTRREPADIPLTDTDRHALHYMLATLYQPGPDANALLDRLGVDGAHLMSPIGTTSHTWWHDTLKKIGHGVSRNRNLYRDLLVALLDDWPGNLDVVAIAHAHGVQHRSAR